MIRFLTTFLALLAFAPAGVFADDAVPPGHSTIHIVFMSTNPYQSQARGLAVPQSPTVHVGNTIGPADGIRLIRIEIDGEFVGHAMVGMSEIKPVFVLPEGMHKMAFTIDGFDPVAADIKVLGTGSKQYLVIKLPSKTPESKSSSASADASTVQPFDN